MLTREETVSIVLSGGCGLYLAQARSSKQYPDAAADRDEPLSMRAETVSLPVRTCR